MKICVVGGGSTYTPELAEGFIEHHVELGLSCLSLTDINEHRLGIVGRLIRRMFSKAGLAVQVEMTTDRRRALEGADFVVAQIRVGGLKARELDERIPMRYGIIGQETTGPGGFAKALRTIPVMLDIASDIGQVAPEAWLINFTNPSGLVTEALNLHGDVHTIGLCNGPINTIRRIAGLLQAAPSDISLDYVGLNHLAWVRGVACRGRDVTAEVLEKALDQGDRTYGGSYPVFLREAIEVLGMIPSGYLRYYYSHDDVLEKAKRATQTRAVEVMRIDEQLMEMYSDPDLKEKPDLLAQRGGALYSKAAVSLISAIARDKGEVHIVNVPNHGTFPELSYEDVVEVPCVVGASGPRPLAGVDLPVVVRGLIQAVKAYEVLTVRAAVTGNETYAVQALLAHPLVGQIEIARELWREIRAAHPQYLSYFD